MSEKKNITTKKNFEYFKERCRHWQKELGLLDWDVHFFHGECDGALARTGYKSSARNASVTLNVDWGEWNKVTLDALNRVAFHEMLHLVLAPLVAETLSFFDYAYIDRLEHPIIQTLINLHLKKMIISPLQNTGSLIGFQWIQTRPHITQKFGENPHIYKQFGMKGHNGLDYRAKVGTLIYAPFEGVAKVVNDKDGYGLHIKIRKDNLECVLGHLSSALVQDGQKVYMGQKIGKTGNSGFSTGPHLHFGIRYLENGNVKDQNNGFAGYVNPINLTITWKGTFELSDL